MEKLFEVTVRTDDHEWAVTVSAADEWKARTKAMKAYPHKLQGKQVEYTVIEL